ncbi:C69 family dipeptidase [Paucibacter sp. AS339]|uniref:dipeptidase n=1 Tax=Paucibacter hankyongi TaxID=3133434 RepID=UPI0030A7540A
MCTVIAIGPQASLDGSTLLSHSDAGQDSRVRKIAAQDHPPGAKAAVHYGLQEIRSSDLSDFGEVLGEIEQVAHTYAYFHSAYSHINEHQLAIAESTTSQRPELRCVRGEGEQIMTVEQAMVFALQRCRKAREAVQLIGALMEAHGFLSSCGDGSELLCIADPDEVWVMEMLGVGKGWQKRSGQPGAIWAARRMPADHALVVANWSILRELDLDDPAKVLACAHVQRYAQERAWFDPSSGRRFDWQQAYIPLPHEWASSRLWRFYSDVSPNLRPWPERQLAGDPYLTLDAYHQVVEPLDIYPFSVKPERLLSLQDVMNFHRSTLEGTIYDSTEQPAWWVSNEQGRMVKSPLATPFPSADQRRLLKLTYRRPVARHFGYYSGICQLRKTLPNDVGGVYWLALGNPLVSTWVPMHIGIEAVHASFNRYDPTQFDEDSARWCIEFVDNLMQLRFQQALPLLSEMREAFEAERAERWQALEASLRLEPELANRRRLCNEFALEAMAAVPSLYREIRHRLIVKLNHCRAT